MATFLIGLGIGAALTLFYWIDHATDAPILREHINAGTDRYRERQSADGSTLSQGSGWEGDIGADGGCDGGGGE